MPAYCNLGEYGLKRKLVLTIVSSVLMLILHGADDLAPQEASRVYAASLPHARLEIVSAARPGDDRAGHFVYDDRPDVFAELVAAFLASVTD